MVCKQITERCFSCNCTCCNVCRASLTVCLHLLPVLQIRFKSSKFEIRHDEVQQLEVELGSLVAPGGLAGHA
jgi:hypothetical protein